MPEISKTNEFNSIELIEYRCDKCNIGLMRPIREPSILTLKQLHVCTFCQDTFNLMNTYPLTRYITKEKND